MKKIIKRCLTKADAERVRDKAVKMGYRASIFMRCGKPTCMISSPDDIPEDIARSFLGAGRNLAKSALS